MAKTNVARAVINTLEELGVRRIFGIPGGASMLLDDAATSSTPIIYTLCGDEMGAAFQAQTYGTFARAHGYDAIGVVQVTSGPAALKLFANLKNASADSQPLLAFTGNVPRNAPPDAFQGCNVVPAILVGGIAKHADYVDDPYLAQRLVVEGKNRAVSGRSGSVLLDFPRDVLAADVEQKSLEELLHEGQLSLPLQLNALIDRALVREIAYSLRKAEKPLVVVGQGARAASKELAQLLEQEDLYAITSLFGAETVSPQNLHNLEIGGMHGSSYANLAHARSNMRVYLGSSIDDRLMLGSHEGQPNPYKGVTIVHVDIDPKQIGKVIHPTYRVVGDVKEFLKVMLQELKTIDEPSNHEGWNLQIKRWRSELGKPDYSDVRELISEHVIDELGRAFEDAYVVTDVGAHQMRVVQRLGRTSFTSGRLGCMGFALGAGIGVITAMHDYGIQLKPVVVYQGDGGTIMNSHEWYDVARRVAEFGPEKVPLKVVTFVDGVLGMVNFWLDKKHQGNMLSSDLTYKGRIKFDFTKLPEVYTVTLPDGRDYTIPRSIVAKKDDLPAAIARMYSTPGPYLLQVMVPAADVTPVIFPGGNTATAVHTYRGQDAIPLTQVLKERGI